MYACYITRSVTDTTCHSENCVQRPRSRDATFDGEHQQGSLLHSSPPKGLGESNFESSERLLFKENCVLDSPRRPKISGLARRKVGFATLLVKVYGLLTGQTPYVAGARDSNMCENFGKITLRPLTARTPQRLSYRVLPDRARSRPRRRYDSLAVNLLVPLTY